MACSYASNLNENKEAEIFCTGIGSLWQRRLRIVPAYPETGTCTVGALRDNLQTGTGRWVCLVQDYTKRIRRFVCI